MNSRSWRYEGVDEESKVGIAELERTIAPISKFNNDDTYVELFTVEEE